MTDRAVGVSGQRVTDRATGVSGRTLGGWPALVRALGQVKAAAARANVHAGVIDAATGRAIAHAAEDLVGGKVEAGLLPADLLTGGGSIAVHVDVSALLAERAGVGVAEVNASQSTADVCHSAHRLVALEASERLVVEAGAAIAELQTVADRFASVPTLARTCLRDAMATPLSTVFAGSAQALARRVEAVIAAREPLHLIVLGGTVIGQGDGAPDAYRAVVVERLGEITGLALRPHPSPTSALQHSDDLAALSSAVAQLVTPTLKLAADLRLLGSGPRGGFGEVVVPHVMDGSSFFTGKSNPVVPETVIQACLQVQGLDHTVQLAAGRAELYLQVFDGLMALDTVDAVDLLANALGLLRTATLIDLAADEERCRELASFAAPTKS